jgi:hypothetical protein
MNNHFHLIVSTPQGNLDEIMNYFMRETSRYISAECGRINQIYGGPYYWSLIKSHHYYLHAYKYVYRNPVEAGLSSRVEEYKFSTLSGLLGQNHLTIPMIEDEGLSDNFDSHIEWLNVPYPNQEIKSVVKKALNKKIFHFPKDRDRHPHILESQIV